jgi:3-oxoadipate enol-lactonase
MTFFDSPGARLHYRLDGPSDAPVVMLSNSLGADLAMWDPQIASLSRRYRVLRYDTRAHGRSSAPAGPYTIEQLARDALALLDALAIRRARFCGLSMGGMIGQWLGLHAGDRLEKLVVASTAAKIGTAETWKARIDAVRNGGIESIADAVLARWFTPHFLTVAPDVVAKCRATMVEVNADGYVSCCEAIRDTDLRDSVAEISVPTLVISGTHDVSTPPIDGRFLADRIQGARYVELDAAHVSNIEAAAQFSAALTEFL